MKFSKQPKLTKKIETVAPRKPGTVPVQGAKKSIISSKTSKSIKTQDKEQGEESKNNLIEITGKQISKEEKKKKKEDEADEFFENRVLKALPADLLNIPDLKYLAEYLQRDICVQNPNVRFTDIVGLDEAKYLLKEAVLVPLKYPHFFSGLIEPWKGVLLFGPPGTGKTLLAKAVATECKTTFFNISASSLVSKWRGDSEKLIRVLFEMARHYQPSTIFLDEIDAIMSQRTGADSEHEGSRRMKTELLVQLDGLIKNQERVFLLAASNLPWDLDMALLRRLEKRILVTLPNQEARLQMIEKFLPEGSTQDVDYQDFSERLQSYSGSDIRLVCKEAAMKPLRRLLQKVEASTSSTGDDCSFDPMKVKPGPVTQGDIDDALASTKPSPSSHLKAYEEWMKNYGSI